MTASPPLFSFMLLAYGKFKLGWYSGQRLPGYFSTLGPRSAYSCLLQQRANVQENLQTKNLSKPGPGWLASRGPCSQSSLVSYQQEPPLGVCGLGGQDTGKEG